MENRLGFTVADILLGIEDVTQLVGPELALATLYTNDSAGIIFFIQTPAGQEPGDLLTLLFFALDMLLDGDPISSQVDGVTRIERSIAGTTETEYYAAAAITCWEQSAMSPWPIFRPLGTISLVAPHRRSAITLTSRMCAPISHLSAWG